MNESDSNAPRQDLARKQASLIHTLHSSGSLEGFDPDKMLTASRSLILKRAGIARKSWPALANALGTEFLNVFLSYASDHAPPDRAELDGSQFAIWLRKQRQFPPAARIELALWQVRHGFPIRVVLQANAPRLTVVYRVIGGVRVRSFGGVKEQ
jgi:hypothetical protein